MKALIERALDGKVWAVVGATRNTGKFGYRIMKRLQNAGYLVYPLNPMYPDIEGEPCYSTPNDLPQVPDCVSMVVGPEKGMLLLDGLYRLGVRILWFQPGAYDDAIIEKAEALGFRTIYGPCVLVELNPH